MRDRLRPTIAIAIAMLLPLLVTTVATAQAEIVVASDNFNRANESPLVVGGNWQRFTFGGFANLTGNQMTGVSADALYYWQGSGTFDNARQFSRVHVTNASGQVGLVLLGTSTQALVAAWNGGTLYIYWYTGSVNQGALTTMPSTLQNGDFIEAVLDGGTISAKVNGLVVATVANTTSLTSGRPGFETYQTGATFDDWVGGIPAGTVEGECVGVPDGTPCDDGDACTKADACLAGACVGEKVVCAPSDPCQGEGVCDPTSGFCDYPPATVCDDHNACTTDTCDPLRGCVYTPIASSCDDGNPCTRDACDPAGGCTHTGSDGPDNSCGAVTDSSLCALPLRLCGSSSTTRTFRLLEMQDAPNAYIINASNPGQFYYNVFQAGTPGAAVDLDIEVPFPFVTQGAHPIQVHDRARSSGGCFQPGASLSGFTITTDGGNRSPGGFPVILRSDFSTPNLGDTTSVHVSGTVPSTGLLYVTIHLDYGLKKVTGWQQATNGTTAQGPDTNLDGTLDGLGGGPIFIDSPEPYDFGFSAGGPTHTSTPASCNKFKKNPGVHGITTKATDGDPVPNLRVQLIGPTGVRVATTTTDSDGAYRFAYKHKGKAATYTVKLPDQGKSKTVTLKSGGFARADFDDL